MTANFGTLSHTELNLDPGLNIIRLPNEGGKTTWCAFLRMMLYGPEQGRKNRSGERGDRSYAPWDGSPMFGELELTHAGRDVTLRRFDVPGGPMRGFAAVYTGTNQPVSGLNSSDAGELLTGMSLSVFRRTAFIGPAGIAVDQSSELEKKITALVSSGEEGTSFSEAAERLRAGQRRLRSRGRGQIPALEAERDELRKKSDEITELLNDAESLEAEADELSEQRDALRAAAPGKLARTEELLAAQRRTLTLERELRSRENQAEEMARALRSGPLRGRAPTADTDKVVGSDQRRARLLERELRSRKGGSRLWLVLIVLAVLLTLAGILYSGFLAAAAVSLTAGLGLKLFGGAGSREREKKKRELSNILKKYGADYADDIPDLYAAYVRDWRETRAARAAAEELRTRAKAAADETDKLRLTAEPVHEDISAADMAEEIRQRNMEAAMLRGKLEALGDPVALRERLDNIEGELARLGKAEKALETALDELAKADEEMQARFSPALSRETETVFRALTGGKYGGVALGKDLSAAVSGRGDPLPRDSALLSRGARDQLYLALRLALCDLIPSDEPCPIILDDALVTFDDQRMGYALDCLSELSKHRQILLFTCQSRESEYLKGK